MSTRLGFLALDNRYVIEGRLVPDGAVHVGSGLAGADTDAAFMRDGSGPFVPGSSLRGVLRSTLERVMQAVDPGRGCVLFVVDSHPTCFTAMPDKKRKKLEDELEEDALNRKLFQENGLCDICRLFGSPLLASKLRVSDCRPVSKAVLEKRDGVGIDRDTETAREKIKFDFEALEQSTELSLRLEIENARDEDFALLAILLSEMQHSGICVGGKKSRGLGRCQLKSDFSVSCFDSKRGFPLKEFLKTGKLSPAKNFAQTLSACLNTYLEEEKHASAGD